MELPDPSPSAEQKLLRRQQGQHLIDAVRRLPLSLRQVVMLTLEGLDYAETAAILGISENNVGVRMSRARDILRQLLEGRK